MPTNRKGDKMRKNFKFIFIFASFYFFSSFETSWAQIFVDKSAPPMPANSYLIHQLTNPLDSSGQEKSILPNRVPEGNGEMVRGFPIVSWKGRGLNIDFSLRYNSAWVNPSSDLGLHWTHNYHEVAHVKRDRAGEIDRVIIYSGSDRRVVYKKSNIGLFREFIATDGHFFKAIQYFDFGLGANVITVRGPQGNIYQYKEFTNFPDVYFLVSIKDTYDNAIILIYDEANGRINSITDPLGKTLVFSYNSQNLLSYVLGPDGRSFSFQYDGQDRLEYITYPEVETWLWYLPNVLANSPVTDLNSWSHYFVYDNNDFLSEISDLAGNVTFYKYYSQGVNSSRLKTITDTLGNQTKFFFNNIQKIGPFNFFDKNQLQTIAKVSRPNEPDLITHYSASGLPTREIIRPSSVLLVVKPAMVLSVGTGEDPLSNSDRIAGKRIDNTPINQIVTRYTYDALYFNNGTILPFSRFYQDGLLTSIDYPLGNQSIFVYDFDINDRFPNGNLIKEQRIAGPRGDGKGNSIADLFTTYEYEPIFNQVIKSCEPRANDPSYLAEIDQFASITLPSTEERYCKETWYAYMESPFNTIKQLAQTWGIDENKISISGLNDINLSGAIDPQGCLFDQSRPVKTIVGKMD